jgi:hypothetical protein
MTFFDPIDVVIGISAIALIVILCIAFWATVYRRIKNKRQSEITKKDRALTVTFIMIVAVVWAVSFTLVFDGYTAFYQLFPRIVFVFGFIIYSWLLFSYRSPKPKDLDEVYDAFSKDFPSVSVRISKHFLNRWLYMFVDEKKVAKIYSGREVNVHIPEGTHDISFSRKKPSRLTGEDIEVHDGLVLLVGSDMKNKMPFWIMSLPGDEAALEEATRKYRRRNIRLFGACLIIWIAAVILNLGSVLL